MRNPFDKPQQRVSVTGWFDTEIWRRGTCVSTMRVLNGAVEEGLSTMLNAAFAGGSGFTNLYVGLVKFLDTVNTPTAIPTITDTMSSNGWLDFEFVEYNESTRQALSFSATSSPGISGGTVLFNIEAGANLQGFFVCSDNTKGGTAGTLWASAMRTFFGEGGGLFTAGSAVSNDFTVLNGDELSVTYSVMLSPIDS